MAERKKLELQPNEPKILKLQSDALVGTNSYGEYQMYIVSNGTGEEYSFFCPNTAVYEQLKTLKRGGQFEITKTAKQNGKGIKIDYIIKVLEETKPTAQQRDNYFDIMLASYEDALKIQEKLNGMVDVNRISITLFIARSKLSGSLINS